MTTSSPRTPHGKRFPLSHRTGGRERLHSRKKRGCLKSRRTELGFYFFQDTDDPHSGALSNALFKLDLTQLTPHRVLVPVSRTLTLRGHMWSGQLILVLLSRAGFHVTMCVTPLTNERRKLQAQERDKHAAASFREFVLKTLEEQTKH